VVTQQVASDKRVRLLCFSPVYAPFSLLRLKLVGQLQQHFGEINKQAESQTLCAELRKLSPAKGFWHLDQPTES